MFRSALLGAKAGGCDYMKYVMEDDQYYNEEESHTNFFYRDGKGPKGYETGNYDGPDSL